VKVYDVRAEFQGGFTANRPRTEYIVVHHAAALYSTKNGLDDVRAVANWHIKGNGWSGIGYQECLAEETEGGDIAAYVVSNPLTLRANVAYRNDVIFGISCLTNFEDITKFPDRMPSEKWRAALAERIKAALVLFPNAKIVGHKEITVKGYETACPGSRWLDWKNDLISRVKAPAGPQLEVLAAPRMSRAGFIDVLTRNASPAAPAASALWDILVEEGIDPAVGLAFFKHESTYGKAGVCFNYDTKNWGNVRTAHRADLASGSTMAGGVGPFAMYATWEAGLRDWCLRIKEAYIAQRGLKTVEQITPVYAPSDDGNRPKQYAAAVWAAVESYKLINPSLVIDGLEVDPAFVAAFNNSGAVWRGPAILTPGKPIETAFLYNELLHQLFERSGIRRNQDGSLDWLFQKEVEELKAARLANLQNL
jgi:hypothetical protein